MSAISDTQTDWQADVLRLKGQGLSSSEIAEQVGKHAATVRKVIARAKDESGEIPGQTTVDDFVVEAEIVDDRDPLETFKEEAGEATGELQDRPGEETPDAGDTFSIVRGSRQLALDFGPNAAMITSATIVLKSDRKPSGYYGLGDIIQGTFTARVTKAPGEEKYDKDLEDFVAKPTNYTATITEFSVEDVSSDT